MRLLALDTALDACSVAVLDGGAVLAALSEPMQRGHQERLAPMAQAAMQASGLAFANLDRVAVTVGPGSFTGLRVGLAFAKALALALGIPCIGVGTLEALAALAGAGRVAAALDARRGQVYLQPFDDGAPLAAPQALGVSDAVELLAGLGFGPGARLAGSGAALLAERLPGVAVQAGGGVDVVSLGRMALHRPAPVQRPQPLYLRAADARTLAERAATP